MFRADHPVTNRRSLSPWTSRTDLYPSEAAFAAYFLEIRLPTLLEKAIELVTFEQTAPAIAAHCRMASVT